MRTPLRTLASVLLLAACSRGGPVPAKDEVPVEPDVDDTATPDSAAEEQGMSWRPISAPPMLRPRVAALSYWVGSGWFVWGGEDDVYAMRDGARYDPNTDTWTAVSVEGAPGPRSGLFNQRAALFGGGDGHLLTWGGHEAEGYFFDLDAGGDVLRDGAIYHLLSDTWTPMRAPPDELPYLGRNYPHAAWTGTMLLVFGGGSDVLDDERVQQQLPVGHPALGARFSPGEDWFSPDDDEWRPMSPEGAPAQRKHAAFEWTGEELLVWGGQWEEVHYDSLGRVESKSYQSFNDGARYDPITNRWRAMASSPLSARAYPWSCWTGEQLVVWGGFGEGFVPLDDGAVYDPATDTWRPITAEGAPSARARMGRTEWTGLHMIVWGGAAIVPDALDDDGEVGLDEFTPTRGGAIYDPVADVWTPLPPAKLAPRGKLARYQSAWTGESLLVWGGWIGEPSPFGHGARLDGLPVP